MSRPERGAMLKQRCLLRFGVVCHVAGACFPLRPEKQSPTPLPNTLVAPVPR